MTARRIIFQIRFPCRARTANWNISSWTLPPPSPLVHVTRGDTVESLHYGHYAGGTRWIDCGGQRRYPFRDYPRSALKPIQALQLITWGRPTPLGLETSTSALACSSHWAEPFHVDAVSAWPNDSCTEGDLICGQDYPYNEAAKEALLRAKCGRSRVFHRCSGKHAGF